MRLSSDYSEFTLELEREYKDKWGSLVKVSNTFDTDHFPDIFVFRDIINSDILYIKNLGDTFTMFKRTLVYPKLSNDEFNYLQQKRYGFIEQIMSSLFERYNEEEDFSNIEKSFAAIDFYMFGDTSGISVLIMAMGADKIDKVYDIVMNNTRNYVRKLAYFAARFSGLDKQIMHQTSRRNKKQELKKSLYPEDDDTGRDVAGEYQSKKYNKYKDQIDESVNYLDQELKRASLNQYRQQTIDFDKQNEEAIQSGLISKNEIDRYDSPVELYDPKGLTKGTKMHKLLVKNRKRPPVPPSRKNK